MSDVDTKEPSVAAQAAGPQPVKRLTRWVLGGCALMLVWAVCSDRLAPYTSEARLRAFVVPVAPEVAGEVTDMQVGINQLVKQGDVLFQVDPEAYQLALQKAEADLEQAGQAVGSATAGVSAAEAALVDARAQLQFATLQSRRAEELERSGVISVMDADRVRKSLLQARAGVANAEAKLQSEKENLGASGANNARLKAALAALGTARKNLASATVRAPADGGVTSVALEVGKYVSAGEEVMSFVSIRESWVEVYLRENSLEHVTPGDEAEVVLDAAPGRVFKGRVVSKGFAVDWGQQSAEPGKLPKISSSNSWLREPQRFPVVIRLEDAPLSLQRVGGQADVVVYAGDSRVLNALGAGLIRLASLLSYLH